MIWGYGTPQKIFAEIFGTLDYFVYSLVSIVLEGLYSISEVRIFSGGLIEDITDRIYVILGIFMLFKMAITLLKGIVNPDSINDKQAGMQKIVVRVITVLILLLMVPTIFDFAYSVQGHAVEALPKIILGPNETAELSVGESVATTVLSSFVSKNPDCNDTDPDVRSLDTFVETVTKRCGNNHPETHDKMFANSYTFLISTIVGVILVILLTLCSIDVAMRLIKLTILQIVAPIPIITYIDPKSSKDGAFSSWSKECLNTYISLFIQLGVIYFIIHLVQKLVEAVKNGIVSGEIGEIIDFGSGTSNMWVIIFIIIAAFFFMKQAPKYIMKVLGIKSGASLGVGLSAGLAGIGALTGGGGLLGTVSALNSSISDGVAANAEGKSAFDKGGWKKGKDMAMKFKTGDPKAEGKPFSQTVNDKIMARKAASLGFTSKTVDDAKTSKFAAADAAANAASLRTRFQNNGVKGLTQTDVTNLIEYAKTDKAYKDLNEDQLKEKYPELIDAYVNAKNTASNKASKYYDDASRYASVLGVPEGETLSEKFSPKYKARKTTHLDNVAQKAIEKNRSLRDINDDKKFDTYRGFDPNRWKPEK